MGIVKWGLAAVGVAAVGAIAIAALNAGGPEPAQAEPSSEVPGAERYKELLADELGISVEALSRAQDAAHDMLIDEALAAGRITANQAERLKTMQPGELRLDIGRDRHHNAVRRAVVSVFETAADVVGLGVNDLRERLAAGESLVVIAASQDIDELTLKSELTAGLADKVNDAVARGDINQDKADMLLEHLDEMIERAVNAELPFEGRFRFGGPGMERFEMERRQN